MGAKNSTRNQQRLNCSETIEKINLLQPPEELPVSLDVLRKLAKAVCSIENEQCSVKAKGVMVSLTMRTGQVNGLITSATSKALSSCSLEMKLQSFRSPEPLTLELDTSRLFTLYCPLAEIVFIRLHDQTVQQILQYGCEFLDVPQTEVKLVGGEKIYLCDLPVNATINLSSGMFTEYYGLDIRHGAVCSEDSAGLPVFSEKGELVGIQKAVTAHNCTNNLAVSLCSLMNSHLNNVFSSPPSIESVITNPVEMEYGACELKEIGLDECNIPKPKYAQCSFYISPASPYVTPIWYMPTCFGWYWTPNDPSSDEVDSNWMPVTALAVVGGSWNGEIPARKNVKIIRWLSLNNIQWKCTTET